MKVLNVYSYLERFPARSSYTTKVLAVAGAGALVQIALISIWTLTGLLGQTPGVMVGVIALSGIVTTFLTLLAISGLLQPVRMLSALLRNHKETGEVTEMPTFYRDDMGLLILDTTNLLLRLDRSMLEVQEASKIDALSGLLNRRFSRERLQQDLSRSNRSRMSLSVVVIDLDDFEKLNNTYGNSVGDACLQHFATVASSSIRDGDWIGRWGGDEFLVVLWGADAEIAEAVIWRIKRNLANSGQAHEAGIRLTASYGYATHTVGELENELLARADSSLRKAKSQGKNRACGDGVQSVISIR